MVNYAGIRKSKFFVDIDYSPSASSSINPINLPNNLSESIHNRSASYAPVQDSNYASRFWKMSRYEGVRSTSPDFNIPIIIATDNPDVIFTEEATGINANLSSSIPQGPVYPEDAPDTPLGD